MSSQSINVAVPNNPDTSSPSNATVPEIASSKCVKCHEPASHQCGSCKAIKYCSTECQKKDWRDHKIICGLYTDFIANNPRPANTAKKTYHLALLFPETSEQPVFFWNDIECGSINMSPINCQKDTPEILLVNHMIRRHEKWKNADYHHDLLLYCRDGYLSDGSQDNVCIKRILKRPYAYEWKGPFFSMGGGFIQADGHNHLGGYSDFGLADFCQIIFYLKNVGRNQAMTPGFRCIRLT